MTKMHWFKILKCVDLLLLFFFESKLYIFGLLSTGWEEKIWRCQIAICETVIGIFYYF